MSKFKHLGFNERIKIEHMYNKQKLSISEIATQMGVHFTTIYREIRRALCEQKDSELREYMAYSPELAQRDYDAKAQGKGPSLKIGKDFALMTYIENKIANEKFSPAAALGKIREDGLRFTTTISHTTLYRYIADDMFLHISNKDLPMGGRRKKKYDKVRRISYKQPMNLSIEDRPREIENRDEFGHWEMDTVVGKAKGKSTCLLVLTERLTRFELIYKMKQKSAFEVVKAMNRLEFRYRNLFSHIFKSITTDNGGEFADVDGIQKRGRTVVYKCHPYSSWERGSNENANKLIRRFIPKGANIASYTLKEIQYIEHWMNNYPRRILGYRSSGQLFNSEMVKLLA